MSVEVLNPSLYRALKRVFGEVRIQAQGEAMQAEPYRDPVSDEPRMAIEHAGEYYVTCCPFCSDTRFRLWINHRWGKDDAWGRHGSYLAICYNESCLSNERNRSDLRDMVSTMPNFLEEARIKPGKIVKEEDRIAMPPGPLQRLDTLPLQHKANAYLHSRGFDPTVLGRCYDVCYCQESHFTFARDRIIITIYDRGKFKGWQARYIGELPWKDPEKKRDLPPKYFTMPGMKRGKILYNFDVARDYQTGILVEGPMDVWRIGSMAMGYLGNMVTMHQRDKFLKVFRKRSGVLVPDPEEFEEEGTRRRATEMRHLMSGQFACVKLPDGTDPGSLDRYFLRDYIAENSLDQEVRISYEKVKA